MLKRNRFVDSVLTGAFGYALILGYSACFGGSSGAGGGVLPDGSTPGSGGAGSGSGVIPEAHAELSGSRLKAKRMHGADGSSQFESWVDTALGVDCAFYQTMEGTRRCLPYGPTTDSTSSGYFGDPACTVPATSIESTCQPLQYVLVRNDDPATKYCNGGSGISSVHKAVQVAAKYNKYSSGECELVDTTGETVFAAGEVIPLGNFVEAQSSLDP
jgi:hypothetical protein